VSIVTIATLVTVAAGGGADGLAHAPASATPAIRTLAVIRADRSGF
jgi:hypothetical protein